MQRFGFLITAALLLGGSALVGAQEPAYRAELRFVDQLRARGYADLALEYLDRLRKQNPSPDLARLLVLESVKTRLVLADSEPDAGKRLTLLAQTRQELEAFLKANAGSAFAEDARVQLAKVTELQGKTQLDKALAMGEADTNRPKELLEARNLLKDASKQLTDSIGKLTNEEARNIASLDLALLMLELARSYVDETNSKENEERATVLKEAITRLDKVSDTFPQNSPRRWRAVAWVGRAYDMNDQPDEAKKKFALIRDRGDRDSKRVVEFFDMLGEQERQMRKNERNAQTCQRLITAANSWLRLYPREKTSPEGLGVQYVLASEYFQLGLINTATRNVNWPQARRILLELEQTPSEWASKAQNLKIKMLIEEKAFSKKLEELRTFDDLYMRAVYEDYRLSTDDKAFDTADKKEKQRELVIAALTRAVAISKTARVPAHELSKARYMLTGYYFNTKQYRLAAEVGEQFARAEPRSSDAPVAAVYAAQSMNLLLEARNGEPEEKLKADRDRLYALAKFMVERWPGEPAADFGRSLCTDHLMRTGQEDEAKKLGGDYARFKIGLKRATENKFPQAVQILGEIQPKFLYYTHSQYRLALAALQAERDGDKPMPPEKRSYKEIALAALESIPAPPPNADPSTNLLFIEAKKLLCGQYYTAPDDKKNDKAKYDKMDALCKVLLANLDKLRLAEEDAKNEELRKGYRVSVETLEMYSMFGRTDLDYSKGRFADVVKMLDPLIDRFGKGEYAELKQTPQLRGGLFSLCMRANIQESKITRAIQVLDIWGKLTEESEREKELLGILAQMVGIVRDQIATLTAKKDTEGLNRTRESFAAFFAALEKRQTKPSFDFQRFLAIGYENLGKYAQAAALLEKAPAPKMGVKMPDGTELQLRAARLLYIRMLRLDGKDLDRAEELLAPIMKDWGARDLRARLEEIMLLEARKKYSTAFNRADALLKLLQPKAEGDPKLRDPYFECYYHMCYSLYKYGVEQAKGGEKDAVVKKAAFEVKRRLDGNLQPELTDDARKLFTDLLESEEGAELKKAYEALKK